MADPYIKAITTRLDFEFLGFNFKDTAVSHLANVTWQKWNQNYREDSLWTDMAERRQKAYHSPLTYSNRQLFEKIFEEGGFKHSPLITSSLQRRTEVDRSMYARQEPHKSPLQVEPIRAAMKIIQIAEGSCRFGVKYLNEEKISFKDYVSCVFPIVSKSEWTIPCDWARWCTKQGYDVRRLGQLFDGNTVGLNVFDYYAPFCLEEGTKMSKLGATLRDSFYWEESYGIVLVLTPEQQFDYRVRDHIRIEKLLEYTNRTRPSLEEACLVRSFKVVDATEEDELTKEDIAILDHYYPKDYDEIVPGWLFPNDDFIEDYEECTLEDLFTKFAPCIDISQLECTDGSEDDDGFFNDHVDELSIPEEEEIFPPIWLFEDSPEWIPGWFFNKYQYPDDLEDLDDVDEIAEDFIFKYHRDEVDQFSFGFDNSKTKAENLGLEVTISAVEEDSPDGVFTG